MKRLFNLAPNALALLLLAGCGGTSTASSPLGEDAAASAEDAVAAPETTTPSSETCVFAKGALPAETLPVGARHGDQIPVQHIIVLMQENRSFDHYFGRLPALGKTDVDGLPADASNPDAAGKAVKPFHLDKYCTVDTEHSWGASHKQYDAGKNDGFIATSQPNGERAMGYYDQTDLPYYYGLAQTFAIADRYFASVMGPTHPNRFFLYGGTADGETRTILKLGVYTMRTVFSVLAERGISWKIYYGDLSYAMLFQELIALPELQPLEQYFVDAKAGTLPAVAFIDLAQTPLGGPEVDEHPSVDIQLGQAAVAEVIDALMASPNWKDAALFLTYDEHGGFYDHVPPPAACIPDDVTPQNVPDDPTATYGRLGFRVPLVLVSPFAKPGFVSHVVYDHASILRFIETRHELPAFTRRDANADPMLDLFNFDAPPFLTPPKLPKAVVDPAMTQKCLDDGFQN